MRNKENSFPIRTLIWSPALSVKITRMYCLMVTTLKTIQPAHLHIRLRRWQAEMAIVWVCYLINSPLSLETTFKWFLFFWSEEKHPTLNGRGFFFEKLYLVVIQCSFDASFHVFLNIYVPRILNHMSCIHISFLSSRVPSLHVPLCRTHV